MKILVVLFLVSLTTYNLKSVESNNNELTNEIKKAAESTNMSEKDIGTLWKQLFSIPRTTACRKQLMKAKIRQMLLSQYGFGTDVDKADSKFWWVKQWGYGPSAYLLDFMDPVFQQALVKNFKTIYSAVQKLNMLDTKDYQDPFDRKKLLQSKIPSFQKMAKNKINKAVYEVSANANQINLAFQKFKWFKQPGSNDPAGDFVSKYDMDEDGRLNARELILGLIWNQRTAVITKKRSCINCLENLSKKLDALFVFLDCTNKGYLTAEELWNNLPKLSRGNRKWNVFAIENSDNIRTNAINDFILKNGKAVEGGLTKEEFRNGMLLGFWDRQTAEMGIVEDDSRNLKELRWNENGMNDTVAFLYYKEKLLAEMIAESQGNHKSK